MATFGNPAHRITSEQQLRDLIGMPTALVCSKVTDRLKAGNVPVVLRVDLPDEPKAPTRAEYRKKKAEEREEPLAVLEDRKARWPSARPTPRPWRRPGSCSPSRPKD